MSHSLMNYFRRAQNELSTTNSNPNSVQVLQSRFQVLPGRTHVMCVPEYFVNVLTTLQQWYELEQYKKIFAVF
jgi:hypothetical protein